MIRRLQTDGIREATTGRMVSGGRGLEIGALDNAPAIHFSDTEAYRKGYAEGFEAGESDGLREANERTQRLEGDARHHADELANERKRLATLVSSLSSALDSHGEAMEALAFEVALAGLARVFGQMQDDQQLLKRMCAQVASEFRAKGIRLVVSEADRPDLPERIDGLPVMAEAGLALGECRVVMEHGHVESSIRMRLDALYGVMIESLGVGDS